MAPIAKVKSVIPIFAQISPQATPQFDKPSTTPALPTSLTSETLTSQSLSPPSILASMSVYLYPLDQIAAFVDS